MSLAVLTALLLPLLMVAAVVVLVVVLLRRPDPAPSEAAEAARRHGTFVTVLAWTLPLTVGPLLLAPLGVVVLRVGGIDGPATWHALLAGLYPAIIGLEYLGVHAVGERTWPRPAGPVRRAALVRRRVADVAPRWLRRLVWALASATVAALIAFGATAASDDRSLRVGSRGAGPYPGLDFGIPLLIAVVLVVVAAEAVLRLVAARPSIVDADPAYDVGSRRLSAHRVLRGVELVIGGTLAGVLLVGGIALQNVEFRELGATVTVLGILVGLGSVVVAALPARPPASATELAAGPVLTRGAA